MKRKTMKFLSFILSMLMLLALTACDSSIRDAKKAYKNQEYKTVVDLLEGKVDLDEDTTQILLISKANIAFDAGDYLEVVKDLFEVTNGNEMDIYVKAVDGAIDAFISSSDIVPVKQMLEYDKSIGDKLDKVLEDGCNSIDYNYFLLLDIAIDSVEDTDLVSRLTEYRDNNRNLRAKSFMLGEWEWQSDSEVNTRINNKLVDGQIMGIVTQVGNSEIAYQICLNDIYWKDYVFIDETNFTCYNLTKTTSGNVVDVTAVGTIDYENDTILLHLTAPAPFHMVNADRTFQRVA